MQVIITYFKATGLVAKNPARQSLTARAVSNLVPTSYPKCKPIPVKHTCLGQPTTRTPILPNGPLLSNQGRTNILAPQAPAKQVPGKVDCITRATLKLQGNLSGATVSFH